MRLRFILSEVGKGIARNKAITVSVVIVTFVSLLFVGIATLSQAQVGLMKGQWYDKIEVSIYMCAPQDQAASCDGREASAAQIGAVRAKLASSELQPYVRHVYEETKEQAYQEFKKMYGNSPLAEWTTPDMLQFSFRVKLVDPEQYRIIQEEFAGTPGVSQVQDQSELVDPLFQVIDRARQLSLGLGAVMIVAAVLLITTTIQLSALSRQEETQIMRLVGASTLFIQAPFMIEGAIAALIGALLAVGALFAGVHFLIDGWLAQAFQWTNFVGIADVWRISPILIGAALLLALVASAVSLARYTRV